MGYYVKLVIERAMRVLINVRTRSRLEGIGYNMLLRERSNTFRSVLWKMCLKSSNEKKNQYCEFRGCTLDWLGRTMKNANQIFVKKSIGYANMFSTGVCSYNIDRSKSFISIYIFFTTSKTPSVCALSITESLNFARAFFMPSSGDRMYNKRTHR